MDTRELAPLPGAVHAKTVIFPAEMTAECALQQAGEACLDQMRGNESAVLAGQPDALHQMRLAIRRLRALLSAFADIFSTDQDEWVDAELRWLSGALGPARDLEVFEAALLQAIADSPSDPLVQLAASAARQRRAAYGKARRAIRSTRYASAMRHLMRRFEGGGSDHPGDGRLLDPIGVVAPALLDHRWSVVLKRGKGFATETATERHKLRIALKKLRYLSEMLCCLFEQNKVATFTARLKWIQDELGYANDLRVGRDIVRELARDAKEPALLTEVGMHVLAEHEDHLNSGEAKFRKHLRKLLRATPYWHRAD